MKTTKMVGQYVFGPGALGGLGRIRDERTSASGAFAVYFVDHFFERLVLDPDLTSAVPCDQYFYSGMDTYIHRIESLDGNYRHGMADALSQQALVMCRDVFLSEEMQADENREKLMVASYLGGKLGGEEE